jgi:hypothetical protein
MLQQNVKIEVYKIINKHQGRKNPIKYKDILRDPTLSGATKIQVSEAIKQLRNDGETISSRPNVGYYFSKTEMKGCLQWCQNWRKSMGVNPLSPKCLEWV